MQHLSDACKLLPDSPDLKDHIRQRERLEEATSISVSVGLTDFILYGGTGVNVMVQQVRSISHELWEKNKY
jgi:hypothetical protein